MLLMGEEAQTLTRRWMRMWMRTAMATVGCGKLTWVEFPVPLL